MAWKSSAGNYTSTQTLTLQLVNNRSTSITYALTLVARGLNGEEVTRSLATAAQASCRGPSIQGITRFSSSIG
ncbi:hypothetical protein BH09MYX1_BH09MYX1_41490 [soil metagenome]